MTSEPQLLDEARGAEVEATLWGVVSRLRARGWHISLWEIQRAQDVVAYLHARLHRAPTDDELLRHLRPILCARESELAVFAEAFRDSSASAPLPDATATTTRRRRSWLYAASAALVLTFVIAVLSLVPTTTSTGGDPASPGTAPSTTSSSLWTTWLWSGVIVGTGVLVVGLLWFALHKRLRRRPAPRDPGHDLELRWATTHPLDNLECVRMARALRARSPEPGTTLDVRRTVDASIRAGLRLTPRFVQHKRTPEYLAVIEQRSTHDVLAAYHASVVDQISAQGVVMRRVGLQPRSQLVLDPLRGRRRLEALQPTSERERLLLFAHDWALRDPLSGDARPWLTRFDRWADTTQIGPDVDQDRRLPVVDRALRDVRNLDPAWQATTPGGPPTAARTLPAVFETGDELWIEPCAPSGDEVIRALELLGTSLGPDGWYWLSACALYPEISYDLTVSLGRLLRGEDGEPVATHVDIAVLSRLPWFRHAYMPDWFRATLISTLSHGQLVEARAALDQILVSGLVGAPDGSGTLSVAAPPPGMGRRGGDAPASRQGESSHDRVYLDGSALRRRRLATTAPKQLVTAMRRQRRRLATVTPAGEAPSLRVRRALIWCNALLVVVALATSVALAVMATRAAVAQDFSVFAEEFTAGSPWARCAFFGTLLSGLPATIGSVFSPTAGRQRGLALGVSELIFLGVFVAFAILFESGSSNSNLIAVLLAGRLLTLTTTVALLMQPARAKPVSWPVFHKRSRIAFLGSLGIIVVLSTTLMITDPNSAWGGATILAMCSAGSVLLAAAYFNGVRAIPLFAGGTIVLFGLIFTIRGGDVLALLFGLPGLLVLAAFWRQLQRARERPPLDFWETAWSEWKWPLAVAATVATAAFTWYFSGDLVWVLWLTAVPATWAVLNLAVDLLAYRVTSIVARYRLDSRLLLHLN